jgi:uncharacterized protein DUF6916
MPTSRRSFLKSGTMIALGAGVPAALAKTVLGTERGLTLANNLLKLKKSDFEALVNSKFRVHTATRSVDLTLATVTDLKRPVSKRNEEGFSLLFDGPTALRLRQETYLIEHKDLGKFRLLIVPVVSRKKRTHRYEIIINRIYS